MLKTEQPGLGKISLQLRSLADKQRSILAGASVLSDEELVGRIDTDEPPVIQRMRQEPRLRGKKLATERAYIKNVNQFFRFCGTFDEFRRQTWPQVWGKFTCLTR